MLEKKERKCEQAEQWGKAGICVFSLQHNEAPTVETFTGTLSIASHPAYTLVDTGATHSCISDEYRNACGLYAEYVPDYVMCVSTPLGPSSMLTRVV